MALLRWLTMQACLLIFLDTVEASSIFAANFHIGNATLSAANRLSQRRGPDATTRVDRHGWTLVHNLLWMTGSRTFQPYEDDRLLALFNGEIYNYHEIFPEKALKSDGDVILPAYRRWGLDFGRILNGEFAIVILDFESKQLVMLTDTFGTKPLWYGHGDEGHFAVATYRSMLLGIGFNESNIYMADPNTLYSADLRILKQFRVLMWYHLDSPANEFRFGTAPVEHRAQAPYHGDGSPWPFLKRFPYFEFNLTQYKTDTADWIAAFRTAIIRRTQFAMFPLCLGLSSGHDSGAIHAALRRWSIKRLNVVSIAGTERRDLIDRRGRLGVQASFDIVEVNTSLGEKHKNWLSENVEPSPFLDPSSRGSVFDDQAWIGLSVVVETCKTRGAKVLLSGHGVDEIVSDYSYHGWLGPCAFLRTGEYFPRAKCCGGNFCGIFPDDLRDIFPWQNFYLGKMREYLIKEEHVAGAHGFETRYPFLDRDVVQEYLSLTAHIKNSNFKRPLRDFFQERSYPYNERKISWSPFGIGNPNAGRKSLVEAIWNDWDWTFSSVIFASPILLLRFLFVVYRKHLLDSRRMRPGNSCQKNYDSSP